MEQSKGSREAMPGRVKEAVTRGPPWDGKQLTSQTHFYNQTKSIIIRVVQCVPADIHQLVVNARQLIIKNSTSSIIAHINPEQHDGGRGSVQQNSMTSKRSRVGKHKMGIELRTQNDLSYILESSQVCNI